MAFNITDRSDGIATCVIERTGGHNALTPPLLLEMRLAIDELLADPAIAGLVLTGSGRFFCPGGDVAGMATAAAEGRGPEFISTLLDQLHPLILALHHSPKPLVAAINGIVAGGGLGIAAVADRRLANREAVFVPGYPSINLTPDGGATWLLPQVMGPGHARRFMLANEILDAEAALMAGLVDDILPPEELIPTARYTARQLVFPDPAIRAQTIGLLDRQTAVTFEDQLARERELILAAAGTEGFREATAAFVKRD